MACLQRLTGMGLEPARQRPIGAFVGIYLPLTDTEAQQFQQAITALRPTEQEAVMVLLTEWEQKGRAEATRSLVQRLLAAKRDMRLPSEVSTSDRCACLIRDASGDVQYDRDEREVVFRLLAERDERRSLMMTTNVAFAEWSRIVPDPMTTRATLDREVQHSVMLAMMSMERCRAEEADAQQSVTSEHQSKTLTTIATTHNTR
ncbi:MAG: ATP-binding protein [Chloroflexales bacterium]|nr:ATP-binding protein [Chloroflexales bacterium]